MRPFVIAAIALVPMICFGEGAPPFDAAAAFGALPSAMHMRLSPDGNSVAYISPINGIGTALFTYDLHGKAAAKGAFAADGKPARLRDCSWVSNARLVCTLSGVVDSAYYGLVNFSRIVATDRNGGNQQILSTESNEHTRGFAGYGGAVIDWLPDEDGNLLMSREYIPDAHMGSRIGSTKQGLGVDHVDTRTLKVQPLEPPAPDIEQYLSDGRGTVRIIARQQAVPGHQASGVSRYLYRKTNSRDWLPLSTYDSRTRDGFLPEAIDFERNVAYGFDKKDGRQELVSVALDGSLQKAEIAARSDVDIDGLVSIGRRHRVVGVSYATDRREVHYFDPDIEKLHGSLARALHNDSSLGVVDASLDEQVMLLIASSDDDPGVYYLFDKRTKALQTFLTVRAELEGVKLAKVRAIKYSAADGTLVPGYLTLPPNVNDAKNLPAIVLPHGGPSARDEWGFDWLAQFYAARGYAVLQPNYRGSAGYGDAWLKTNGFKSWRTSIGDVLDAGRWLVAQGIADPAKLCVVGWSYGGYAALQSAVMEPGLFKAVVAIAPVTDLEQLKEEWRGWSNFELISAEIGDGPHVREGSPARNAEKIKVPVILFHGTLDRNVSVRESRTMDARLEKAGVKHQTVIFEGLDHQLEDPRARADMLRRSDAFLRAAIGG